MSEIEKMYKNAGIKPYIYCSKPQLDCNARETGNCKQDCEYYSRERLLAPFTTEKQIELIKYFSNNYNISINKDNNIFRFLFINKDGIHNFYTSGVDFAEQLALFVISRYKNQILTEEERKQIKEILE